jgi:hypothetical protein
MFTAESIKLLAKRRQIRTQCDVGSTDELRPNPTDDRGADERLLLPPGDDPNDSPDPDYSVEPDVDIPPPEMPAEWWTRMVLDPDQTPVTPTDVQTVFEFINRRLAPGATAGTKSDSITTVGELHESIARHFGPAGWTALVSLWQEAAGIQQPKRQPKTDCAPIIAVEPDGKADTPLPPLPAQAYPLEEGLYRASPEMPPRVAAFSLHAPRDPPAWRIQESEDERAERQALENLGAWTG